MRERALRGDARTYYELMSPTERDQLDRALDRIEQDPRPDNVLIFDDPGLSGVRLFDNGIWRVGFTVPDDATIVVFAVKHALDLPD
jgi:hypothetical protein